MRQLLEVARVGDNGGVLLELVDLIHGKTLLSTGRKLEPGQRDTQARRRRFVFRT
jgi:hypothetical protein